MTVRVKFFASLREQVGCEGATVEIGESATVADIWLMASGGRPMPAHTLTSRNQDYCSLHDRVESGDEIAFFPPVTGG
ncbi:MoaD/ThiS family protein [Ectothiorhodospiraceae bacterium BW-2]|nr:MoaD/ThiS family protein [Ectothiorhodospiraceae bacterium BW-2]